MNQTSVDSTPFQLIKNNLLAGDLDTAGSIVKVNIFSTVLPAQDSCQGQSRAYAKIMEGPCAGYIAMLPAKNCPGHLKSQREDYLRSLYGQTIDAEVVRISESEDGKNVQIGLSLNGDWRRKREAVYKSLVPASGDSPGTMVVATIKEKHLSGVFCTFPHEGEEVGGFLHFTQMAFRESTRKSMLATFKVGDVVACEVLAKKRERTRPLFDVKLTLLAQANRKRRDALRLKNIDPDAIYTGRVLSAYADHYKVSAEVGEQQLEGQLKRRPFDSETLLAGQSLDLQVHMVAGDGTILFSLGGINKQPPEGRS